ncbi:MAG: protein kinase [Candidatus Melainabacteria bacterium]|nr:protein kinase [Candidatus Melainabacteria bacterium]
MPESGDSEHPKPTQEEPAHGELHTSDGGIFLSPDSIILDRYKVLGLLGKGGMGSVYHLKHLHLQSEFALKVLNKQADDTSWRRFENEAKAASRLDHPNLIKVHDSGLLPDGQPFFIMELVTGETLADIIKKNGNIPLLKTLKIFIQVGFALAYAHENGVIHRDLKPSNIMIAKGKDGSLTAIVKVVDLGIAKLTGIDEFNQQTLTRTGEIFGSPLYMSPEQCIGVAVDHRTDLYSLGCSMYEALTGAPPMIGENALSTMMKHQMEKPISLKDASMGRTFPAEVETLVAKLLEKDPDRRYSNAQLLTHDLVQLEQMLSEKVSADETAAVAVSKPAVMAKNKAFFSSQIFVVLFCSVVSYFLGFGTSRLFHQQPEAPPELPKPLWKHAITAPQTPPVKIPPNSMKDIVPFSSISTDGRSRHFNFPSASVGDIRIGNRPMAQARGLMSGAINEKVFFVPAPDYLQSPALLNRFAPDDLDSLFLEDEEQNSPNVLVALPRLKSLTYLRLSMQTGDEAGQFIDQLPKLDRLGISHTNMTGAGVARLKCFPNLKYLACSSIRDVRPIIDKLPSARALEDLRIDDNRLTGMDLRAIAKHKQLKCLSIGGHKEINDEALAELKPLKNLEHLFAVSCPVTEKSLSTFQTLKKLSYLRLSGLTKQQMQIVRAGLKCKTIENVGGGDSLVGAEDPPAHDTVTPLAGSNQGRKPVKQQ